MIRNNELKEKLADLEHQQWAHWTIYMLDNLTKENLKRWGEQVATPYSELSEKEKDSDRIWADKVLRIIHQIKIKNQSILSPAKIHFRDGDSYLCNYACYITEEKCTKDIDKVTCKNCLRKLKRK